MHIRLGHEVITIHHMLHIYNFATREENFIGYHGTQHMSNNLHSTIKDFIQKNLHPKININLFQQDWDSWSSFLHLTDTDVCNSRMVLINRNKWFTLTFEKSLIKNNWQHRTKITMKSTRMDKREYFILSLWSIFALHTGRVSKESFKFQI